MATPLETKPAGYDHGEEYGLAVVQTARMPSSSQDGWVDITLNLVAVRHGGGAVALLPGESNSLCFGGEDCFLIQWGSTGQNEAELTGVVIGSAAAREPKAVNLKVQFTVPANADKASLYFGEHEIPLELQGDYAPKLSSAAAQLRPGPTPPPSGDAKTENFFMDSEHGLAVSLVNRSFNHFVNRESGAREHHPLMATARVELSVLSLGDYDATAPELSSEEGSVCLGKGECLEIWWGPESRFNAVLTVQGGEEFAKARRGGARWPLPLVIEFDLPAGQRSAVLEFGESKVPLDLRGMTGGAFDYTAYFPQAEPGSLLYDRQGKTITLDSVTQDPETGALELAMTAANGSEASDFSPVLNPVLFSASGQVDIFPGSRLLTGETLAPGQDAALRYAVPRGGSGAWGYVPFSKDPEKRPDGVVFQVNDTSAPPEDPPPGTRPQRTRPRPTAMPGSTFIDAAAWAGAGPGGMPAYVRFNRTEDEGKFWPVKALWKFNNSLLTVADGVVYTGDQREGNFVGAVDAATGEQVWEAFGQFQTLADGVVYTRRNRGGLHALDAATGEPLWQSESTLAAVADGVAYVGGSALDAATGEQLWQAEGEYLANTRSVTVVDGVVYAHGEGARRSWGLHALDAATGGWTWGAESHLIAVEDGVAYYRDGRYGPTARVVATGKQLWQDRSFGEILAAADGVVYTLWQNEDRQDRLVALDAATGEQLWQFGQPEGGTFRILGVADGVAYADGRNLNLYALDPATGEQLWQAVAI